jgi:UDP-glucose 4-epimerase
VTSNTTGAGKVGPVFVTGAGGFIGAKVACGFGAAGRRVVRLGHGLGEQSKAHSAYSIDGPIGFDALAHAASLAGTPALVIHAAGGSSVAASVADPSRDFERTVGSLNAVLQFIDRQASDARLIFLSSAAVYGSTGDAPIPEDTPLRPISPYGHHKKVCEDLVLERARAGTLDAIVVRLFSVYGPGNRKQLFWDVARRLSGNPRTLELAGTGTEARDFLYIDDAVALIRLLSEQERGSSPFVLNGGSGSAVTVREAAETLRRALGAETKIVFTGAQRVGDPSRMVCDTTLARTLGFAPRVPFATGVERFAEWAGEAILEVEGSGSP